MSIKFWNAIKGGKDFKHWATRLDIIGWPGAHTAAMKRPDDPSNPYWFSVLEGSWYLRSKSDKNSYMQILVIENDNLIKSYYSKNFFNFLYMINDIIGYITIINKKPLFW